MLWSKMRFSEEHQNQRVWMAISYLRNLVGRMAIASANLPQVLARHAVKPVNPGALLARGRKNVKEGSPVVSPIQVEANTLAKLALVDLSAQPLIDDMLISGKNRFHSQHQRPIVQRGFA